jgi:hypothetical protein
LASSRDRPRWVSKNLSVLELVLVRRPYRKSTLESSRQGRINETSIQSSENIVSALLPHVPISPAIMRWMSRPVRVSGEESILGRKAHSWSKASNSLANLQRDHEACRDLRCAIVQLPPSLCSCCILHDSKTMSRAILIGHTINPIARV